MNEKVTFCGCTVVSSWATTPPDRPSVEAARQDYREIMRADLLIVDTTVPSSSGGLCTEIGIALGRPIPESLPQVRASFRRRSPCSHIRRAGWFDWRVRMLLKRSMTLPQDGRLPDWSGFMPAMVLSFAANSVITNQ
jgi:hypothetical protein